MPPAPRLTLRAWRDDDLPHFARINADPRVAEFLPSTLTRDESDAMAGRIRAHFDAHGFGLWAVELRETGAFIGFTGLARQTFDAPFTPCVEIAWRLDADQWGRGYATEAARIALARGFDEHGLREIVSFTVPDNRRSIRIMEKLGMTRDPADDFDHPRLAPGHPLRRHILYRILAHRRTTG
jgi:RimJ/RimL family protein N-acetyltransferase